MMLSKYRDTLALRRFLLFVGFAVAVLLKVSRNFVDFTASTEHDVTFQSRKETLADILDTTQNAGFEIPTISCGRLLQQSAQHQLGFVDPNHPAAGPAHLATTKTFNPFHVSLHNKRYDHKRWVIQKTKRYDEPILEKIWQRVLQGAPTGSCILDVGANIGYFTLLSGSMQTPEKSFQIYAFEPNLKNVLRLCESVRANDWMQAVHIHPIGVSKEKGVFNYVEDHYNPGASHFNYNNNMREGRNMVQEIPVITLDHFAQAKGWLQPDDTTVIAIMKLDVEGFEPAVILGAQKLLQTRKIRNIFMEITVTTAEQHANVVQGLQSLEKEGYQLEGWGRGKGPGEKPSHDEKSNLIATILERAKKNGVQLNLWWKLANDERKHL